MFNQLQNLVPQRTAAVFLPQRGQGLAAQSRGLGVGRFQDRLEFHHCAGGIGHKGQGDTVFSRNERGVKMPSFLGYMAWSGAILIPLFILIGAIFFR